MKTELQLRPGLATSRLTHWLILAQQTKDTVTIIGLNVMLLLGILFAYGLPLPGLVLYVLRWRMLSRSTSRRRALWVWGLSAVHELCCALLFITEARFIFGAYTPALVILYSFGLLCSLAGLVENMRQPVALGITHPHDE